MSVTTGMIRRKAGDYGGDDQRPLPVRCMIGQVICAVCNQSIQRAVREYTRKPGCSVDGRHQQEQRETHANRKGSAREPFLLEVTGGFEPPYRVLQTLA